LEKATAETAKVGPSPEVVERIKKAIAQAETLEEVTRLEKALKSGVLPDELKAEEPAAAAPTSKQEAPSAAKEDIDGMKIDG